MQTAEYVTEEVIHRAFDQFGSVVDVSIKQSAVDQVHLPALSCSRMPLF